MARYTEVICVDNGHVLLLRFHFWGVRWQWPPGTLGCAVTLSMVEALRNWSLTRGHKRRASANATAEGRRQLHPLIRGIIKFSKSLSFRRIYPKSTHLILNDHGVKFIVENRNNVESRHKWNTRFDRATISLQ